MALEGGFGLSECQAMWERNHDNSAQGNPMPTTAAYTDLYFVENELVLRYEMAVLQ